MSDYLASGLEEDVTTEDYLQALLLLRHQHPDGSAVALAPQGSPDILLEDEPSPSLDREKDIPAHYGLPNRQQRKIQVWCTCGQEFDASTVQGADSPEPNAYGLTPSSGYRDTPIKYS